MPPDSVATHSCGYLPLVHSGQESLTTRFYLSPIHTVSSIAALTSSSFTVSELSPNLILNLQSSFNYSLHDDYF